MDPVLEQRYRNRASLPPEERAAVEEAYAAALAEYETKYRTGSSPADLDPADAAATPITPDPTAGPARSVNRAAGRAIATQPYSPSEAVRGMRVDGMTPEQAQSYRVRQIDADLSVDNPVDQHAVSVVAQRYMADGYDRPTAIAKAKDYVLRAKQEVRNDMDSAPATDRSRAAEARQASAEQRYNESTGMQQDSGLSGQDGSGRDWSNWSPGMPLPPMAPDGSVLADNARRAREAERVARNSRERNEAIGKKYGPRAQEIAEAGDARGVTDYDATRTKAEQARVDYRRQLEWDARNQAPNGAARQKLREQDHNEGLARKEFRAKLAATPEAQAAKADRARRQAAWRAQSMLAGGQPTGGPRGTKAAANAWTMMGDPGITDEQRSSLRYMLPGGQLAAGVDANQLEAAAALAQRAVTGALAGTAQGPLAQAQAEMAELQAQARRDELRREDEDILGEKYAPSGWFGYDEFTVAEQQQMYDDLIRQGYKPADAQRAVDRQAKNRRATERHRWAGEGA